MTNIFDYLYPKYKIQGHVRLIEMFAGIGSQAKALENLGVDFEHWKVIEFDKHAIDSYNAIHGTNFHTSDIRNIHACDLDMRERERDIHSNVLIPMSGFKCCRKHEGDEKRSRHKIRTALGS